MSETTIEIPRELTRKTVAKLSQRIDETARADSYVVDCSRLAYAEPFGMLLCAAVLRRFVGQHRTQAAFRARGVDGGSYAAHMGFYQSFGPKLGNLPGKARGSSDYIPITSLKIRDLAAGHQGLLIGEAVAAEATRLAEILIRRDSGAAFSQVAYAFTEIMRNVVEHSRSQEVWDAAQHWPQQQRVEIAILDEGVGIRSSLARNPAHRVKTDLQAILRALERGVSGSPPPTDEDLMHGDSWRNTGYGLYIVSNLCSRAGAFSACSGDTIWHMDGSTKSSERANHKGTAIRMVLRTSDETHIRAIIDNLMKSPGHRKGRSQNPGL